VDQLIERKRSVLCCAAGARGQAVRPLAPAPSRPVVWRAVHAPEIFVAANELADVSFKSYSPKSAAVSPVTWTTYSGPGTALKARVAPTCPVGQLEDAAVPFVGRVRVSEERRRYESDKTAAASPSRVTHRCCTRTSSRRRRRRRCCSKRRSSS
jgi:hypothetical protein